MVELLRLLLVLIFAGLAAANANSLEPDQTPGNPASVQDPNCLPPSSYFTVVGPNVFRLNHESTVLVSIYNTNNQQCSVWLQYGTNKFSQNDNMVVANERDPLIVTMKVTEKDIFDDKDTDDGKPKYVKLMASCMGVQKETDVLLSYKSGYLIVQLDKPLYSPGQRVNYRILALDENLKGNKDAQLAIDIIDPLNRTVRRTKPVAKGGEINQYHYIIPKYADLGLWTVRAFYLGNYSTEARVTFNVEEYVLPTFGVKVEISDRFIAPDTEEFTVDVKAEYVYGKPVVGNVALQLFLRKDADGYREFILNTDRKLLNDGRRDFTLITENVLNMLPADVLPADVEVGTIPPPGYSLEVKANVFEDVTSNEEEGSDDVVFAMNPYKFSFKKSIDSYSPDFLYKLQVDVLYANGDVVTNGDVDLTMEEKTLGIKEETTVTISKGRVSKQFETPNTRQDLEFTATFNGVTSQIFTVKPYAGSNKLRMELIEEKQEIELRINSNVGDSNLYSKLTVMIIARGNIEWFKQKDLKRSMTETIDDELLGRIAPSARAVAYYVIIATGEVVASSIRLDVHPKCRGNGLSLNEKKGQQYEPGAKADLFIKGVPLMHVGLNAMDSALLLLNSDNILKKNTGGTCVYPCNGGGAYVSEARSIKLRTTKTVMFNLLDKHDLGCGPGGGFNSEEVFKRAGVTILTNTDVNSAKRASMSCDGNSRKKRSAASDLCYNYNVNDDCCLMGAIYAQILIDEKDVLAKLQPDLRVDIIPKCHARSKELLKYDNFTALCINAYLKNCLELVYDDLEEDTGVGGKSDDDESDYMRDIRKLNMDISKIRYIFKESWLFDTFHLSNNGEATKKMKLPDSITTWHIQGIGYSERTGVCIAEPLDIVSQRKFFIQLDLPYSAVRLENVNVKMSVFNYYSGKLEVHAYLEGQKDMCSMAKLGEHSPRQKATVLGNNATSFDFLVLPLVAGPHKIEVTAFGTPDTGATQTDAVRKTLLIVNEGKEISKTINVCLDPVDEMKDCANSPEVYKVARDKGTKIIKLTLRVPKDAVAKTGHAVGYIKSNLMSDVAVSSIQGTDTLIRMPWGCGEQTMIGLAPGVYSMYYLKQTKQMTPDIEDKGNEVVRNGVERELTYRQDTGGYAAWKHRQPSTWLTAFVAKVFCQADKAVDGSVDEALEIVPTLKYLLRQDIKEVSGKYIDTLPVIHRSMMGQVSPGDPSLTAFVVTSFMECNARTKEMNTSILESVRYLEEDVPLSDYQNDPYLLAITTYALGLTKSPRRWDFMAMLEGKAIKVEDVDQEKKKKIKIHWGTGVGHPASANDVETTSYALLAYLTFNKLEESASIVRWLSLQRQAGGSFRSTQDTVVALQALSEYTVLTYKKDVKLKVHVVKPVDRKLNVTTENAKVLKVIEGLHGGDGDTNVTIKVEGRGNAILSIDLTYNMPAKDEPCPFNGDEIHVEDIVDGADDIDEDIVKQRDCDVCGRCADEEKNRQDVDYALMNGLEIEPKLGVKIGERRRRAANGQRRNVKKYCVRFTVSSEKESDMAIVRFGLQTRVNVILDDLEKLMDVKNTTLARYETPATGKNYVVFYLDKIGPEPMSFTFRVTDDFTGNVNTRQKAKVDVYEYYNPDRTCTKFYGVDSQPGKPIPYECAGPSDSNCQCLQHMCAENYVDKFLTKNRKKLKGRPASRMIKHICVNGKANYAVLVKITQITNDPDRQLILATGEVKQVIHGGKEDIKISDEMTFRYRSFCEQPKLDENKQYYIIGKNGIATGNNTYEYELMMDAIVVKKPWKKGPLKKLRLPFEHFIKGLRKGCPM